MEWSLPFGGPAEDAYSSGVAAAYPRARYVVVLADDYAEGEAASAFDAGARFVRMLGEVPVERLRLHVVDTETGRVIDAPASAFAPGLGESTGAA
jgi:hypothetical protein